MGILICNVSTSNDAEHFFSLNQDRVYWGPLCQKISANLAELVVLQKVRDSTFDFSHLLFNLGVAFLFLAPVLNL